MSDTGQRVLKSACEIFAERGFSNSTLAEICNLAEANVASANYYFKSKENLYREAVRFAYKTVEGEFPLDAGVKPGDCSEKRMHAYMKGLLQRIFTGSAYYRMLAHEFSNPNSPVDHFFREWNRPERAQMQDIIQEIAQKEISRRWMHTCMINVNSLCMFFAFNQKIRRLITEGKRFSKVEIDELADHLTRFAMGGVGEAIKSIPDESQEKRCKR